MHLVWQHTPRTVLYTWYDNIHLVRQHITCGMHSCIPNDAQGPNRQDLVTYLRPQRQVLNALAFW